MGRKRKLNAETQTKLCDALTAGNYRKPACIIAGISESTLYRWLEVGEADIEHDRQSQERELWEAVQKAEADAEAEAVRAVRSAMDGSWQAAMTYLERKFPQRWGRRDRLEHSGRVNTGASLDLSRLSDEELDELDRLTALASEQAS